MHNILLEAIAARALSHGQAIAIEDGPVQLTWSMLNSEIQALAQQLKTLKLDTIALYADNSWQWVVVDLACMATGTCLLPLPTFFSSSQLQYALSCTGPDALVLDSQLQAQQQAMCLQAAGGPEIHCNLLDSMSLARLPGDKTSRPPNTAKITFTSGSTGAPKGVCLSTSHLLTVAESLAAVTPTGQSVRHLCLLPPSTLLENLAGIYVPLLTKGTVVIPQRNESGLSGSSQLNLPGLLACLEHYQPTSVILVPQLLSGLVAAGKSGRQIPRSLNFIAVGGSKVSTRLLAEAKELNLPVYEGYGLSECASVVSLNTPDHNRPGSVGKVLPHTEVSIQKGEIVVRNNAFLGYLNQPDSWGQTAIHTGDLGHLDDSGYLYIEGRKGNLLISSWGRNISPEWVESELLYAPEIDQCLVLGDARPFCVALLYSANPEITDQQLTTAVNRANSSLPDYARIRAWHRIQQPFSADNGQLTANFRPRRKRIIEYYHDPIEQLYRSPENIEVSMHNTESATPFYDRLQTATQDQRQHLLAAPIIAKALSGDIRLEDYVAFLTEAYHHVKHTIPLLMAVGARLPESMEWLREAVAEYIEEELGHQEWILNDIEACGGDRGLVRNGTPAPATELMVAYAYDTIQRVNPVGFFGMVQVLEGTSVAIAERAADCIRESLGLPDSAFSYLTSHGALDQDHIRFFEGLMNRIDEAADQQQIIHSARMFYRLYGDIFRTLTSDQNTALVA